MKKYLTTAALLATMSSPSFAGIPDGYSIAVEFDQNVAVAPEMLDWWWNNITTEERFVNWNPEHHLAYELTVPPANAATLHYSPGTSQNVSEYLGGFTIDTNVTWQDQLEHTSDTHQLVAEIRFRGLEDLSVPGNGWLIYDYEPDAALEGTDVHVTLLLPEVARVAFPGIRESVTEHLQTDLANLPDFLPELFQKEFIEEELESRGTYRVEKNGFWLKRVVVDQEIKSLTPDMMNWWWDNMGNTDRYKRWHPTAHVSFEWLVPPSNPNNTTYSVGAVQRVDEYLGKYKNVLLITWLPKEDAADRVEYEHWLYAKTDLDGLSGIMPQKMTHEYQTNAAGDGIVMRSTFDVPFFLDWVMPGFTSELGKHALQEMQCLQYFLPTLFAEQTLDNE